MLALGVNHLVAGVVDAAKGIAVVTRSVVRGLSQAAAAAGAENVARLAKSREIDGVVAATDVIGVEVIHAFRANGVSVPEDVSVIGCDFNAFAGNGSIGLSSVDLLSETMGATAMTLALGQAGVMDGGKKNVVLEPRLVERAT